MNEQFLVDPKLRNTHIFNNGPCKNLHNKGKKSKIMKRWPEFPHG